MLLCLIKQPILQFFNTVCKTYLFNVQVSMNPRRKYEMTQFIVGFAAHKTRNCSSHETVIYSAKTQYISVMNPMNLVTYSFRSHYNPGSTQPLTRSITLYFKI